MQKAAHQLDLQVVWSKAPLQIHSSSAFTYMRTNLQSPALRTFLKHLGLLKIPLFFFPDFSSLIHQPLLRPLWTHAFHTSLSLLFQKEIVFLVRLHAIHPFLQPVYTGKVNANSREYLQCTHLQWVLRSQWWGLYFHFLSQLSVFANYRN